jgi:two-component system cell cycle response regulator DivK
MPQKILYIEDNQDNIKLVERITRASGYACVVATDGASGLRLALSEAPSLILLDINLPDMDGFEVVARLREDPRTTHIPVLALTANALKGDYEKCLAAGCDDYIAKPLRLEELRAKIQRLALPEN